MHDDDNGGGGVGAGGDDNKGGHGSCRQVDYGYYYMRFFLHLPVAHWLLNPCSFYVFLIYSSTFTC